MPANNYMQTCQVVEPVKAKVKVRVRDPSASIKRRSLVRCEVRHVCAKSTLYCGPAGT